MDSRGPRPSRVWAAEANGSMQDPRWAVQCIWQIKHWRDPDGTYSVRRGSPRTRHNLFFSTWWRRSKWGALTREPIAEADRNRVQRRLAGECASLAADGGLGWPVASQLHVYIQLATTSTNRSGQLTYSLRPGTDLENGFCLSQLDSCIRRCIHSACILSSTLSVQGIAD